MLYQDFSPLMQRYTRYIVFLFCIGITIAAFSVAYFYVVSGNQVAGDTTSIRQMSVTGEGKISVKPDIAVFSATVVTQAEKVGSAQSENTKRGNAILDFLKKSGVGDNDLKTTSYNIYPQYTSEPCIAFPCPVSRPPKITSYEVRSIVEIKVRDVAQVDDLLQGVVEHGANEVGSFSFTFDKPETAQAEARKKAIEDARAKARVLGRDLGVRVKRIINFSESGGYVPMYYDRAMAFGVGGSSEASAPNVAIGEQEITSNVTIVYEFL